MDLQQVTGILLLKEGNSTLYLFFYKFAGCPMQSKILRKFEIGMA